MENNDFNNYNKGGNGESNTKTLAIAGFVLSFFISLAGLIVSAIALNKYKQTGESEGKSFATAGLIINIVSMVITFISVMCFGTALMAIIMGGAAIML